MAKFLFIDTETTGLDPKVHGLHQVSCILASTGKDTGYAENFLLLDNTQLDLKFRPHKNASISPSALTVVGISYEELMAREMSQEKAFELFNKWMSKHIDRFNKTDKFVMAGYNVAFDEGFIREWFRQNNDRYYGSWFWNSTHCVRSKAIELLADKRAELPKFKLESVCKYMDIEVEGDYHDSMVDIRATYELWKKLNLLH